MSKHFDVRIDTTKIIVHCTDTPPHMDIDAATIQRWHIDERGWQDIGYHFVIRRDGTIEHGRPIWAVGAHVSGQNLQSVGICLAGGAYRLRDYTPRQLESLRLLVGGLQVRYPATTVHGHCDFTKDKTCPNFDVHAWWVSL